MRCIVVLGVALASALAAAGCAVEGKRVDASVEAVTTHDFNPKDLEIICENAVADLIKRGVFPEERRPVVYVAPVVNRTDEHINTDAIASYLAFKLSQSGRVFLVGRDALRDEALRELERQQSGFTDPATARAIGKHVGAEYFLQGKIMNIVSRSGRTKAQYFQFELALVDIQTLKVETTQVRIQKVSRKGLLGW